MNTFKKHCLIVERAMSMNEGNVNDILYHGTSIKQFEKLKNNGFKVVDFYLGDDLENIAVNYAEIQSQNDGTDGVVIYFDRKFINKSQLKKDYHDRLDADEPVEQIGQYIFTGDLSDSVITAFNVETKERIYMSSNYFEDGE